MKAFGSALAALAALAASSGAAQIPTLERRDSAIQLVVDGRPFLILGGELGNSSASSAAYMAPIWPRLRALGLNTVLAPAYWELIEAQEGHYDFASVDAPLEGARANDLHLVLLWFGAWKNSMSTYAPAWVKRDTQRFPRVHAPDGTPEDILSAFAPATRDADARAFAALMAHLRTVDGTRHTVLMVQVENEIGMLPAAREHGPAADAALGRGAWPSEEVFTATAYAHYVEAIAAAGRARYPLPMYVNAALNRPGQRPGDYPAGGPLPHLFTAWRTGAPSLAFLAPDIYFPNFSELAAAYAHDFPLFVPEAGRAGDPHVPANAWLAFGRDRAIGFSPFSIESIAGPEAERLGDTYRLIQSIAPQILTAQAAGTIRGFAPPIAFAGTADTSPQRTTLGPYVFTVNFVDPWTPADAQRPAEHGGLILQLGPEEYLVAGEGITITVATATAGAGAAGIERAEEGHYVDGVFRPERRMNGDQTHQGRHIRLPPGSPSLQLVRLYTYR